MSAGRAARNCGISSRIFFTLGLLAVGQVLDGTDARGKERLRSDLPILRAEVRHAVQWESAFTVTDVALRRTDLGNLGDRSGEGGRAVGEEMQKLLGWSDAERDAQVNRYLDEQVVDAR